MIIPKLSDAKRILTAHHLSNIALSLMFFVAKGQSWICERLFYYENSCEIDSREREILMFLAVVIVWKGRKATNWLHYISNVFLFSKVANSLLFLRADLLIGIIYVLLVIAVTVIFPEPMYDGPENITYFQGDGLFNELTRDRRTTWFIMFYATWSPDCKHVNPVFAELSERFTLPNLRFGKLDVGRYPKAAEHFRVNAHPTSRQLPTICCFEDAKEIRRRPLVNDKRRAIPFVFNQENCILEYDMLNIYNKCKEGLNKKELKKMEDEKKKD
ncbi:unnamed protein product, partial [Mesorhabditis belari]|uniref:Thioredoxin domain-containing protein n=1 Tax=Mesorhabditis belari TaxID=2138241 RepID=A0AAF3EIF7_9BILA